MTIETCERMRDNCLKHKDAKGAAMYQARIDKKRKKYPHKYPAQDEAEVTSNAEE